MSSRTQEILLNTFFDAAGGGWTGVSADDILRLLAEVQDSLATLAKPVSQTGQTKSSTPATGGSTILSSALGMAPLVKAMLGLFGGGEPALLPSLVKFALPPSLQFEAANTMGGVAGLDYGQGGLPRLTAPGMDGVASLDYGLRRLTAPDVETAGGAGGYPAVTDAAMAELQQQPDAAAQVQQVNVPLQTMDSRWFLDHSAEIAHAVREAMLNMNSLNDVVSDL